MPKPKNEQVEDAKVEEQDIPEQTGDPSQPGEEPTIRPEVDAEDAIVPVENEEGEVEAPKEHFAVILNPKLSMTDAVELEKKMFYRDREVNRNQGTPFLTDIEYERFAQYKDPESGAQYVVKDPKA